MKKRTKHITRILAFILVLAMLPLSSFAMAMPATPEVATDPLLEHLALAAEVAPEAEPEVVATSEIAPLMATEQITQFLSRPARYTLAEGNIARTRSENNGTLALSAVHGWSPNVSNILDRLRNDMGDHWHTHNAAGAANNARIQMTMTYPQPVVLYGARVQWWSDAARGATDGVVPPTHTGWVEALIDGTWTRVTGMTNDVGATTDYIGGHVAGGNTSTRWNGVWFAQPITTTAIRLNVLRDSPSSGTNPGIGAHALEFFSNPALLDVEELSADVFKDLYLDVTLPQGSRGSAFALSGSTNAAALANDGTVTIGAAVEEGQITVTATATVTQPGATPDTVFTAERVFDFSVLPQIDEAQVPTITAQPATPVTIDGANQAQTLSVTANVTDRGSLSYQWYADGVAIPGATERTFTVPTDVAGTVEYHVVVTNTNNRAPEGYRTATIASDVSTVTVVSSVVSVTVNPTARTIRYGGSFRFIARIPTVGGASDAITWTLVREDGATLAAGTGVDNGNVTIGETEPEGLLILTVAADANPAVYATAVITVTHAQGAPSPNVYNNTLRRNPNTGAVITAGENAAVVSVFDFYGGTNWPLVTGGAGDLGPAVGYARDIFPSPGQASGVWAAVTSASFAPGNMMEVRSSNIFMGPSAADHAEFAIYSGRTEDTTVAGHNTPNINFGSEFYDVEIHAGHRLTGAGNTADIVFRFQDTENFYFVRSRVGDTFQLGRVLNGNETIIAESTGTGQLRTMTDQAGALGWRHLRLTVVDDSVTLSFMRFRTARAGETASVVATESTVLRRSNTLDEVLFDNVSLIPAGENEIPLILTRPGRAGFRADNTAARWNHVQIAGLDTHHTLYSPNNMFRIETGAMGNLQSLQVLEGRNWGRQQRTQALADATETNIGVGTYTPIELVQNEREQPHLGGRHRSLGDLRFNYQVGTGAWQTASTGNSGDTRMIWHAENLVGVDYLATSANARDGIRDFNVEQEFSVHTCDVSGDFIRFEFTVTNTNDEELTIRDLSMPTFWNHQWFGPSSSQTSGDAYAHFLSNARNYVSYHGSYIMLERMDGASSKVVLIPDVSTNAQFEYRRYHQRQNDNYSVNMMEEFFIYSAGIASGATNGTLDQSYLPNTQLVLAPAGEEGSSSTYGFKMFHINDYVDLHALLYDQGLISTVVNPNTVTFLDIESLVAVYAQEDVYLTDITPLPSDQAHSSVQGNQASSATWFTEENRDEWGATFRHIEDRCDDTSCTNCGNDALACTGRRIQVFGITFNKLGRNDIQVNFRNANDEAKKSVIQFWLQLPLGNETNDLGEATPGVLQTHADFIMDNLWVSPQMQTERFGPGVTATAMLPNAGHSGPAYRDHLSNFLRDHRYSFLKFRNSTGIARTGQGNEFACNNSDYEQYYTVAQFLLEKNISMPVMREVQALEMNLIHMTYAKNVQPFGGYVDSARVRTDEFGPGNPFDNPTRTGANATRTGSASGNTFREGAGTVKCCWQTNGFRMGGAGGRMAIQDRMYNLTHMANQFFSMYQILRNNPHVNDWLGPNNQFVNYGDRATNHQNQRTWDSDRDVQWCAVDYLRVAAILAVESTRFMRGYGQMGESVMTELHAALLYEYAQGNHGTFTRNNPCAAMQPLPGGGHTPLANQGQPATSNRVIAARLRQGLATTITVAQIMEDGLTHFADGTEIPTPAAIPAVVSGASGLASKANGFSLTNPFASEFAVDNTAEEGVYFTTLGFGTPNAFGRPGTSAADSRWNPDPDHPNYFRNPGQWSTIERVTDKMLGWTGMQPLWYHQSTSRPMGSDWWNFQYTVGMQGAALQHWFFNFEDQDRANAMWSQVYGHAIAPFVGIMAGQPEIQVGPTSDIGAPATAAQLQGVPANPDITRQGRGPIGSMWFINAPVRPYDFGATTGAGGAQPSLLNMYMDTGEGGLKLWAGLRILHTAVVPHDPHFGLTAYGGVVTSGTDMEINDAELGDYWRVIPQDGLRRRLKVVGEEFQARLRAHQYSQALISPSLDWIEFTIEPPAGDVLNEAREGIIELRGMAPGTYFIFIDGVVQRDRVEITNERVDRNNLTLPYLITYTADANTETVLIIREDLVDDLIAVLGDGVAYEMIPADDADAHDYNVTVSPGASEVTIFVAAYDATVTITGEDGTEGPVQQLNRGMNEVIVEVERDGNTTTTVLHIYRPYGVRFDGMTGVTLEINRGDGWVDYGVFDHYAWVSDLVAGTQVRGTVRPAAPQGINVVSPIVIADGEQDEVVLPVGEVEITGIQIPGLRIVVRHANNSGHSTSMILHDTGPGYQSDSLRFHTWDVAGDNQWFGIELAGLNFGAPRVWHQGFQIDLSEHFYEVTIPESVTGVTVRNAGGAIVNGVDNRDTGSFGLINTGNTGTLTFTFNEVEYTIDIVFDGNCPFGFVTVVRFGGMTDVTLQTNVGAFNAWEDVPDTHDDYAILFGLAPNTRIRGVITSPARIVSLEVRSTNGFDLLYLPVSEVTVYGLAIPGLNIDVRRAENDEQVNGTLLHRGPHTGGTLRFNTFTTELGAEQLFMVQFGGNLGFSALQRFFDEYSIDLDEYFYEVTVPAGFTNVAMRNAANAALHGRANFAAGDPIMLIRTEQPVDLVFTYCCITNERIPFYLDGTNPFDDIVCCQYTLILTEFSPPGMEPQTATHDLYPGEVLERIANGFGVNEHGGILRGGEVRGADGYIRNFQLEDWIVVSPEGFELGGTAWFNRTVEMPRGNVTLSGDWLQHGGRYAIVTFDANSGAFDDAETTVEARSRVHEYWAGGDRPYANIPTLSELAPVPPPTRDGYVLVGWALTDDATEALAGDFVVDEPSTFFAVWAEGNQQEPGVTEDDILFREQRNPSGWFYHIGAGPRDAEEYPAEQGHFGPAAASAVTFDAETDTFTVNASYMATEIAVDFARLLGEDRVPFTGTAGWVDAYPAGVNLSEVAHVYTTVDAGWAEGHLPAYLVVGTPAQGESRTLAMVVNGVEFLVVINRAEAPPEPMRVVVETVEAAPGATNVPVTVSVENNSGFTSILMIVEYDDTKASLVDWEYDDTRFTVMEFPPGTGRLILIHLGNTTDDGTIVTLFFDVLTNVEEFVEITLTDVEIEILDAGSPRPIEGPFVVDDGGIDVIIPPHAITWNLAGGAWAEDFTPPATVAHNGTLTIATADEPTREGHTFARWNPTLPTTVTGPLTVTAEWTPIDHAITWALAGGAWAEGFTPPATVAHGSTLTIAEADEPTRNGFTFAGWDPSLPTTVNGPLTVTATWTPVDHAITWALAGGAWAEGFTPPATVTHGNTLDIAEENEPTRDGFTFAGWEPGLPTTVTGPLTVTATWTAVNHAITWDLAGGAWPEGFTPPATVAHGGTLEIADENLPIWARVTDFKGWSPALPTTVDGPLTVTAEWEDFLWGDVNNDGVLSLGDVTMLHLYILGHPVNDTWIMRGDINRDGVLTAEDVTLLNFLVLGLPLPTTWSAPAPVAAAVAPFTATDNDGIVVTATVHDATPVIPGREILVDFALTETPELGLGLLQMELTTDDLTILEADWNTSSHIPRLGPVPPVLDEGGRMVLVFRPGIGQDGIENVTGTGHLVTARFLVPADAEIGDSLNFDIRFVESSCYETGTLPGLLSARVPAAFTGGTIAVVDEVETEVDVETETEAEDGDTASTLPPVDDNDIADPERQRHPAYMFGDRDGYFLPLESITRAQVATILARTQLLDFEQGVERLPEGMETFDAFGDVEPSNWFYYYVAWAYDAGLVEGYAGLFRPDEPVTRQELATMLARTITTEIEAGEPDFPDSADISNWAADYVYLVSYVEWMVGNARGYFNPRANITRAEVATAVNRMLGRIDSRTALETLYVADEADVDTTNAREFPDVADGAWYFASVLGAANSHYLTRDDNGAVVGKYIIPATGR